MKVIKVYMNPTGSVEKTEIDCEDAISFEFYLSGNRKANISTKSDELIVFLDRMEIIPESNNKIRIA